MSAPLNEAPPQPDPLAQARAEAQDFRRPGAPAESPPPADGAGRKAPRRPWLDLSPMNRRRLDNFRRNRRGAWSLWIFLVMFVAALGGEFIANDRPLIVSYKGQILFPSSSIIRRKSSADSRRRRIIAIRSSPTRSRRMAG